MICLADHLKIFGRPKPPMDLIRLKAWLQRGETNPVLEHIPAQFRSSQESSSLTGFLSQAIPSFGLVGGLFARFMVSHPVVPTLNSVLLPAGRWKGCCCLPHITIFPEFLGCRFTCLLWGFANLTNEGLGTFLWPNFGTTTAV